MLTVFNFLFVWVLVMGINLMSYIDNPHASNASNIFVDRCVWITLTILISAAFICSIQVQR